MNAFTARPGRPVRARVRRNHTVYLAGAEPRFIDGVVHVVNVHRVARLVRIESPVPGPVTLFPAPAVAPVAIPF